LPHVRELLLCVHLFAVTGTQSIQLDKLWKEKNRSRPT
jgi:hypothetical protein